jgi:voltage-gated potassium channel
MGGPVEPPSSRINSRRERWRKIIFESDTPAGRLFDVILLWIIGLSVAVVMLESVAAVRLRYLSTLRMLEWIFTSLFIIEYIARLWVSWRPLRYARSFYGLVDLLSFLPSFVSLMVPGTHQLAVVRVLRLLRVFRILKMVRHISGAELLMRGLIASRARITVFFMAILMFAIVAGTVMYLIEGPASGFTSIPMSVYWAITTVSTVGFGDIAPISPLGRAVASLCMLMGYAVIAVPAGIVTAEIMRPDSASSVACPSCGVQGHLPDANYCRRCGSAMGENEV